jgi:hypothetical protein
MSNPKSKIQNPKSAAPRGAQPGNQNATKHRGGSRRISATVPLELAEWLAQQPNQSAAVVAALQSLRILTENRTVTLRDTTGLPLTEFPCILQGDGSRSLNQ